MIVKRTSTLHLPQLFTSSKRLTSFDRRLTICPVVVRPIDSLLRLSAWKDKVLACNKSHQHTSRKSYVIGAKHAESLLRDVQQFTDLPVNDVTDSHPHLHARSQDMVVVEVLEDRQPEGGQRQASSVAVHNDETLMVVGVIVFKVLDYFPQDKRLDHFDHLLYDRGDKDDTLHTAKRVIYNTLAYCH